MERIGPNPRFLGESPRPTELELFARPVMRHTPLVPVTCQNLLPRQRPLQLQEQTKLLNDLNWLGFWSLPSMSLTRGAVGAGPLPSCQDQDQVVYAGLVKLTGESADLWRERDSTTF